jgi:Mn-dependent DtxR family transcriptional regulator
MNIYKSSEDYLERILVLKKERGKIRSIDLANSMSFTKASVSIAMKKLKELRFIEIDEKGYIELTEHGQIIAENIYERHTILFNFLTKLGVEKNIAYEDACKLEHDISDETFEALKKYINE